MDILNKIIELLGVQNRQQKELTDFLGLKKSTFSAWKNGKSSSYKKYLPEIAKFFGTSVDDLIRAENTPSKTNQLDEEYFSLMRRAQKEGVDPEDIELAINVIKALRNKNKGV